MTKLILARRKFLFASASLIAADRLMPGHSIAKLLDPPIRRFWRVYDTDTCLVPDHSGGSVLHTFPHLGWIYEPIYDENTKQISCWTRTANVDLTQTEIDAYFVKKTHVADDRLFWYDNDAIDAHYNQTGPAKASVLNDTKLKPMFDPTNWKI